MTIYKIIIVCFLVYIQSSVLTAQNSYTINDTTGCFTIISCYSPFWRKDSLGENGFRRLAIRGYLKECKIIGKDWRYYEFMFGTPKKITHFSDGNTVYRYAIDNLGESTPGQTYLDIEVNKTNIIVGFYDWQVDG